MRKIQGKISKWCTLLLTAALILPGPSATAAVTFSDVNPQQNSWALSSISLMAENQILTGYPDGTFLPNETVTKAEWTVMVYRLFDTYRPNLYASGTNKIEQFSDVPPEHWAYKQISDIYDNSFQWGIYGLSQYGQLTFRPDTQLNRLQLANMLYSFFDTRMIDRRITPNDVCSIVSKFKDVPSKIFKNQDEYDKAVQADGRLDSANTQISTSNGVFPSLFMGTGAGDCQFGSDGFSNAQASVLASLQSSGIMTANNEWYFRPLDKVTRAEAVTILNRIYNYLKKSYWLVDYSTIDLKQTGTGIGGAAGGGTGSGTGSNSGVSDPWNDPKGSGPSSQTATNVRDFFKTQGNNGESGTITKNIRKAGEIETAVFPSGYSYLTIDLVSQDKTEFVDMYVISDGKSTLVKQESFPMTVSVNGVREVGLRTVLRDTNPLKKGGNVILSVRLSKENPTANK
ncbi:S-layer homology domain-containing protein [Paenibacillus radicis (ex Xue et al. 2023)]|uniref:S-layer homology domain-containing protein n=1 Tax=Paenibacillus radicis (ex Xue et al. 2023) TaxID=2972489 RepID=A0ABT1YP27_9BACL|nr:S-layer homology domain-containing protein [Paenibacillus radicis (ex Xue et al. 2023)]MCR8633750.1 S-layer homology domain-containing protein [Paenibacillus radicis (ex Xue et al. 2023)]